MVYNKQNKVLNVFVRGAFRRSSGRVNKTGGHVHDSAAGIQTLAKKEKNRMKEIIL
jgi:hypothetical protein